MKKNSVINLKKIQYIALFVYIVSISAFQLKNGIDPLIVRGSFILLISTSILLRRNIKLNIQIIWIIIFWLYYFSSLIWTSNVDDTMLCLNSAIQVIAISIFLPNMINDEDDVKKVLRYIVISLFITSILIIIRTPVSLWGTTRIGFSTGLHVNTAGFRLSMGCLICLYFICNSEDNKKCKIFYIVNLLLFMTIAFFTGSRKSVIVVVVGFIFYEFFKSKGIKKISHLIIFAIIMIIIWNVLMNNEYFYNVIGKRLNDFILTITGTSNNDFSYIERNFFIEKAKELFLKHPIIGYGGDNFMSYMREIGYSHIAYSHNNYFELLSTLGIIGFIIYYSMWIKVFFELIKSFVKKKSEIVLLFFVIIFLHFVLDYWNITYYSDFSVILLVLSYIIIKIKKHDEK